MEKMKIARKIGVLSFGVFVAFGLMIALATAQEKYPSKPISIIVGYPAGGSADLCARPFAKALEPILKQSVVVINKPGAGSAIAMEFVKNSPPDGYTLTLAMTGAIFGGYLRDVPFKFFEDYVHLCQISTWVNGVITNPESRWKTLQDVVEFARKNPGKIKYGSWEVGAHGQLLMAAFGKLNGIDWVHVPFAGDTAIVSACLGNHVDIGFGDISGFGPHVKAGRLRLLARVGEGCEEFTDVPYIDQLGYKFPSKFRGYVGVSAPKGIPAQVKDTLVDACRRAWLDPDFQKPLKARSIPPIYRDGDELNQVLKDLDSEALSVINQIGLKKK